MNWQGRLVAGLIKFGIDILSRVDAPDLDKVPMRGPLLLYANHTGSLEVPLLFVYLQPRPVTGLAKIESWDNPLYGWLFDLWNGVPVHRGEADVQALRTSLTLLEQGYIFALSPEGTRNHTGSLIRARPGVVTLALHSGAPLMPIAHWGGERFGYNLKHLRRTDFHIRVGQAFNLESEGDRASRQVRQQMVDEMMYRLAALLPEEFRGAYANLENATEKYIRLMKGKGV
jgi:1-acyl-sn-glycerol-3-phosphate acyltransferase